MNAIPQNTSFQAWELRWARIFLVDGERKAKKSNKHKVSSSPKEGQENFLFSRAEIEIYIFGKRFEAEWTRELVSINKHTRRNERWQKLHQLIIFINYRLSTNSLRVFLTALPLYWYAERFHPFTRFRVSTKPTQLVYFIRICLRIKLTETVD